jgi:hypothetical protein
MVYMYVYEMYELVRVIENKKVLFVGKRYLERAAGRIPQGLSFPFDVRTRLVEGIGSVWKMWVKLCMQPETNKWKKGLGEGVNYRRCEADPGGSRAYGIIDIAFCSLLGSPTWLKMAVPY